MKLSRAQLDRPDSFSWIAGRTRSLVPRLSGDEAETSVDRLDAGIRAFAVATVLVLTLLGYGHPFALPFGIAVDPVAVALALILYNGLVIGFTGVPFRKSPGFALFLLDWFVATSAVLVTGGYTSPFLVLYYALVIGAALRVGLSRSLLLVGAVAIVYGALSVARSTPASTLELPALAVGVSSLLMVGVTAVSMKHALEVGRKKTAVEENTAAQLRLLNNLMRVVLSGPPQLDRVMRTVAAVSSQALHADRGLAVLFESLPTAGGSPARYDSHHSHLIVAGEDPNPHLLSAAEARITEQVVRGEMPVLIDDASVDPRNAPGGYPGLDEPGQPLRSLACVPFVLSGEVIGVLFVGRARLAPFNETEVSLLMAVAQQMAVAVRLARLYEMERERAARSEERERLERDLLSIVSHELRTPLTSIKTCVGALTSLEESNGDDRQWSTETRLLHNVARSTERLIYLVNETLDMARLRAGRVSLKFQSLNMGDVLSEMAVQVKPLLDTKEQVLALDLPARDSARWSQLVVPVDRRRIEQILLNLLSNANKYAPAGSKITLGATPREGQVKIFVRDDGPGIALLEQQRIFEKFFQGSAAEGMDERADGVGLGLAIARSLVELHGGHIGVQSRPGRGSTFYFTLSGEAYGAISSSPEVQVYGSWSD